MWVLLHWLRAVMLSGELEGGYVGAPTGSLYASTCFKHYVLITRRSKLYYTASGIITPVGGRPMHRLNLCTGWPPTGVMLPDAV